MGTNDAQINYKMSACYGLISSLVEKAIKIQISTKKWAGGNPPEGCILTSQESLRDGNGE